ncbi:hypothetical protein BGZ76_006696, partial [Entomortierella beljakovae]
MKEERQLQEELALLQSDFQPSPQKEGDRSYSRWTDPARPAPSFKTDTMKYAGHGQVDLDKMIMDVEFQFENKNWPANKKVLSFVDLLSDSAQAWAFNLLRTDPSSRDWSYFKSLFLKKFQTPFECRDLRRALSEIHYQEGIGALSKFVNQYTSVAHRITNMSEYDKVSWMIHKLPEKYHRYVGQLFHDNKDLGSFASALLMLEDTVFGFANKSGQGYYPSPFETPAAKVATTSVAADDSAMDLSNVDIQRVVELALVELRKSQSDVVCYNCQKRGHMSRACPDKSKAGYILHAYHVDDGDQEGEDEGAINHPVHVVEGLVADKLVRVLIDSGASGNFLSSAFVRQLKESE